MKEKLFQEAFKKAERQSGKTTKNGVAVHLEKVFSVELNFPTSKITFSRYYEQFIEESTDQAMSPNTELLNNLARYLGFQNYEDFVTNILAHNNSSESIDSAKENDVMRFLKKHSWLIIIILLTIITVLVIMQLNKQRWMIWDGTHYIEVSFNLKKYDLGELKLYNKDRINNLKKIEADCQTEYKKLDGTPNVWYGKNQKKELEYFTSLGLHPETGKSLKPLSDHMFYKYVCSKDSISSNNN
ncbi:hypothetical protein KORDIASMS9_02255 [Kordia sp. SMS9]|uniref:hypothetical protein n=1 Tax=Kordia sp. SMS9 TaxID=2282170 RepID=UPI000E0D24CC|nr:hypothetical protein [Kordia sp. SMS9]AXG70026.1 hypothetical protein KORDIASMS9_02255 [Kordia sp. SMS9]